MFPPIRTTAAATGAGGGGGTGDTIPPTIPPTTPPATPPSTPPRTPADDSTSGGPARSVRISLGASTRRATCPAVGTGCGCAGTAAGGGAGGGGAGGGGGASGAGATNAIMVGTLGNSLVASNSGITTTTSI